MKVTKSGFTIVELLIVIVVIAILAAITIVAYNGIQSRSRDTKRTQDVAQIQKALELYRVKNGSYPPTGATTAANLPNGFPGLYGCVTCYAFSTATNGTWLKALVDDGLLPSVPVSSPNDNSNFYMYWASSAAGYGACTEPFYVLAVQGYESTIPSSSQGVYCSQGGVVFHMTAAADRGVFSNIKAPAPY